jgi:hypothetical protein
MDRLEQELRGVLTHERRALSPDLVSLEKVYAGAARRRRRRTAAVAAAGTLVLAAVAVPASIALLGHNDDRTPIQAAVSTGPTAQTPQTTATTAPTTPKPSASKSAIVPVGPSWDGARVTSMTATSTQTIVVLGALGDTGACKPPNCVRLAQSHDGGRTFAPLAIPTDAQAGGTGSQLRSSATNVRFGSAQDGWLFGDGLWSTHDGGRSWHAVAVSGGVTSLAAAHGVVWSLVSANGGNDQQLWKSPVGSDSWTQVPGVTISAPGDITVFGSRVIVAAPAPSSKVWVSANGGPFTAHPGPCASAMAAELTSSGSLWATCPTGTAAFVMTSSDGVHWQRVNATQDGSSAPNSLAIGARGPGDALLSLGANNAMVDLHADGSQRPVSQPPPLGSSITYIGFTTRSIGYAIDGTHLWRTTDGGDSWTRIRLG